MNIVKNSSDMFSGNVRNSIEIVQNVRISDKAKFSGRPDYGVEALNVKLCFQFTKKKFDVFRDRS